MERLIITGGTGFLGQALARAAPEHSWTPVLVAPDVPAALSDNLGDVEIVRADVADVEDMEALFKKLCPRGVVHLAAFGAGDAGLLSSAGRDPIRAVRVNVIGFLSVLRAAAQSGCSRMVWSSSTTAYGPSSRYAEDPVDEDAPLWPTSVYGTTKAACEFLSTQIVSPDDPTVISLRLPLVYGPGRWYGGALEDLSTFVRDIAAGRQARLEANEQPVDWIYESDAAAAFFSALKADNARRPAYNLVGHRSSLADMGRVAAALAAAPAEVVVGPGDPDPLVLVDGHRAEVELGFRPRYELHQGIRHWVEAEKEAAQ